MSNAVFSVVTREFTYLVIIYIYYGEIEVKYFDEKQYKSKGEVHLTGM